jgi:hypothetical protein
LLARRLWDVVTLPEQDHLQTSKCAGSQVAHDVVSPTRVASAGEPNFLVEAVYYVGFTQKGPQSTVRCSAGQSVSSGFIDINI